MPAVRWLVQAIEREPVFGMWDGRGKIAVRGQRACQSLENSRKLALLSVRFSGLPVVERGALAQGEAGQEWTSAQRGGAGQRLDAARADLRGRVSV